MIILFEEEKSRGILWCTANLKFQETKSKYAAGSLNKGSTSLSLYLPLGSAYVARLTAINEASKSVDGGFDGTKDTSMQKWIY